MLCVSFTAQFVETDGKSGAVKTGDQDGPVFVNVTEQGSCLFTLMPAHSLTGEMAHIA